MVVIASAATFPTGPIASAPAPTATSPAAMVPSPVSEPGGATTVAPVAKATSPAATRVPAGISTGTILKFRNTTVPVAAAWMAYVPVAFTTAVSLTVPSMRSGSVTGMRYATGPTTALCGTRRIVAAGRSIAAATVAATRIAPAATRTATNGATRRRRRGAGRTRGRTTPTGRVSVSSVTRVTATGAVSSETGPRTTWMAAWRTSVGSPASAGTAARASSTEAYVARPASAASDRVSASP